MPLFQPFIKPATNTGNFSHWRRRIAFGDVLASGRSSGFVHLDVDDLSEGGLFAAFAGNLSVREPAGHVQPPSAATAGSAAASATITLYLEPSAIKHDDQWRKLSAAVHDRFSDVADPALSADSIGCLVYRNVSAADARLHLLPPIKTRRPATDDAKWNAFVAGRGAVAVKEGDQIGAAGVPYAASGAVGQCSIGLRTRYGMFDPGSWYQDMIAVAGVQAPAGADLLATLLGQKLPLIAPNTPLADAGGARQWPWSALVQYRLQNQLKYSDWRKLGDLQKSKYTAQLLARVRPASAQPDTARFEFDTDDMWNVFQLEAVAEFYLNLPDPWDESTAPLAADDIKYRAVNLLSLYGAAAQTNGKTVSLDDQLDMGRIVPGRDTIQLDGETARAFKQFRIMAVDRDQASVTLDAAPQLPGSSSWRIFHMPTLINIDAFGARVTGAPAVSPDVNRLLLSGLNSAQVAELNRVNPYDTISLRDVQPGTPHEARLIDRPVITRVQNVTQATLRLDRDLSPAPAGSAWAIPAGVGGAQGWLDKSAYGSNPHWWDNYDGMMFLVAAGEVKCFFPWSSYSSHAKIMSSIKGNLPYRFASYFSRHNLYINAGFRVISQDGLAWGDQETPVSVAQGATVIEPELPWDASLVTKNQGAYFILPAPPRFVVAGILNVDLNAHRLTCGKASPVPIPADPSPYWLLIYDGTLRQSLLLQTGI